MVGGTDVPTATKKKRVSTVSFVSHRLVLGHLESCDSTLFIRVLSSLLTGHSCLSVMTTTQSNLTVGMVGKMTTFELRQEVEKRGLLTELQIINHDTLLRRLVQVIKW